MQPAVLFRLRPLGPWRFGPGEGGQHQVDTLFRSDRLYSALTLAAESLGFLEEWLQATAQAPEPAFVFSSLFPYQADTLFAPPPLTLWPPSASSIMSPNPVFLSKMRWSAARFVPMPAIEALLTGQPILADQWSIDAESGCLLRRDRPSQSPFRVITRTRGAVDRVSGASAHLHSSACVEFEASSGLWGLIRFADEQGEALWSDRVKACFRFLADTGLGGGRSSGWGQTAEPEFRGGRWPGLFAPQVDRFERAHSKAAPDEDASLFWLLSLYSPAPSDAVDWSAGDYSLVVRGGRIQSAAPAANGALKKNVRMVTEGSVLSARQELVGTAVNTAPDGLTHPVYRAGFCLSLRLPSAKELPEPVPPIESAPPASPPEVKEEQPLEKEQSLAEEQPLAEEKEQPIAEEEAAKAAPPQEIKPEMPEKAPEPAAEASNDGSEQRDDEV